MEEIEIMIMFFIGGIAVGFAIGLLIVSYFKRKM